MNPPINDWMLSVEEVSTKLGICSRSVRRLVAAGDLPGPVKAGACSRWFASDVANYLEKLKSQRDGMQRRPA